MAKNFCMKKKKNYREVKMFHYWQHETFHTVRGG